MNNLSNLHPPSNRLLTLLLPFLFLPCLLSGQTPVPLTPGSFNHDAIGENGCTSPNPLTIATAGGMDASGYAFNGASGWPGSLSYTLSGHTYSLQPYTGTNALRVMPGSSATLTLASPTRLANLHFLVTSTEGDATAAYTAHFTDATTQNLMTVNTPDWILGGGTFISNATSTNDCHVKGAGHLFEASGNIAPSNYGKFVDYITVSHIAGPGRLFIFAASTCGSGPYFSTCPYSFAVSCPGSVSYTAVANDYTSLTYSFIGATSGSGSGTGSGSSFNVGTTTVTLTATNSCGTQTCSFSVTVDDNTPPTALCQNASVSLTQAGTASISATAINNGSFDNCGSVSLSPTQFNFFCNYGQQTVTLTVTDLSGNTATCTATVTVSDPIGPVFEFCPGNIVVNNDPGQCNARVCYPSPRTYDDNCPPLTPAGYTYFNQNGAGTNNTKYYYTSNTTPTDYTTASTAARAAGGHLAVITSAAEQAHIPSGVRWLGGSDALVEGTFIWETCEPFGYTNWAAGEPNNQSGLEDHMATWTAGFWNDVNIAGPYGSVLEIEGVRFVQTTGLPQNAVFPIGTTTNTFVATDAAGNTASCQFTVTVNDNTPPTITCPGNISVNVTPGLCTAPVSYPAVTGADNCSFTISQTGGLASGSLFPVGVTTNTFVATDASGNTASCQFTVTVSDNQPPTAVCQNITVPLAGASVTITASQINNGSSDLCGGITLSVIPTTFNCGQVGQHLVALTVTDASGNTAQCFSQVTVVDNTPPVAICKDVTVNLDAMGNGSTTAAAVNNGSTDACGIASMTLSQTSFTCSNVGPNTVTLTVTDVNGNPSTCMAIVTVVDNVPPVAICQNLTVNLDAMGNGSTTAAAVNSGSNDACGISTLYLSKTSFDCSNIGPNTVTLTVTDVNGNASACMATVTVVDNVPPVAICKSATAYLNASGTASIVPADVFFSGSDNCGTVNLVSVSPNTFNCSNVGSNSVTLNVDDGHGNTSICTATVTVVDNVPPVAICQNVTVTLNASGNGSTTAAAVNNGSNDACGIASLALSQTSFNCANVGSNSVTLTVTDVNGNTSACTATVTVVDNTPPTAVCNSSVTVTLVGASVTITAAQIDEGSSDNCSFSLSVSPSTFDCSDLGPNFVTLTATDASNNSTTCFSVVTVEDKTAPNAVCQPVTVHLNAAGTGSTTAGAVNNGSTDNCGIATLSLSQTSFNCSNLGANTVTLTVTDASGNASTCTATVTVVDNIAPTVVCKPCTVYLNASGSASITTGNVFQSGADNCGTVNQVSVSPNTFGCGDLGANTVTLTVNDGHGNTATCTATVTVLLNPSTVISYTLLAKEEISMKNTLVNGNAGAWQFRGKTEVKYSSTVNGFVKSCEINKDGSSTITGTKYYAQAPAPMPGSFRYNTQTDPPTDINVPDNYSGTWPLTGNLFRKIEVGKNSTVKFMSSGDIYIKELITKDADNGNQTTVLFSGNTNLIIRKKMELGRYTRFNWTGGHVVKVYVEEYDVTVKKGSKVQASIDVRFKYLKTDDADASDHTVMNGMFIAKKINSGKYTDWNWDPNQCPAAPPPMLVANLDALTFYAERKGSTTKLQWFTRTGQTNDHFIVERSANELDWHPILKVDGEGPADELMVFNELDLDPLSGDNFYRLRLVSKDGSELLSKVQKVAFPDGFLAIYPNPNGGGILYTAMSEFAGQAAHVEISNALGIVLKTGDFKELPDSEIEWDISGLNSGTYFISVKIDGKRPIVKRFVVQRP